MLHVTELGYRGGAKVLHIHTTTIIFHYNYIHAHCTHTRCTTITQIEYSILLCSWCTVGAHASDYVIFYTVLYLLLYHGIQNT